MNHSELESDCDDADSQPGARSSSTTTNKRKHVQTHGKNSKRHRTAQRSYDRKRKITSIDQLEDPIEARVTEVAYPYIRARFATQHAFPSEELLYQFCRDSYADAYNKLIQGTIKTNNTYTTCPGRDMYQQTMYTGFGRLLSMTYALQTAGFYLYDMIYMTPLEEYTSTNCVVCMYGRSYQRSINKITLNSAECDSNYGYVVLCMPPLHVSVRMYLYL